MFGHLKVSQAYLRGIGTYKWGCSTKEELHPQENLVAVESNVTAICSQSSGLVLGELTKPLRLAGLQLHTVDCTHKGTIYKNIKNNLYYLREHNK